MSVSGVFGDNLRRLALSQSTLSRTADQLGIARVQFQRYLRGDSFPKPPLLQKICKHFGVDARILTEPLDAMAPLMPRDGVNGLIGGLSPEQAKLFGWCLRGQDYQIPQEVLPDGLYRYWVADGISKDTYYLAPVQVGSDVGRPALPMGGLRTMRMYHGRWMYAARNDGTLKRQREVRCALLAVPGGFVCLAFNPVPIGRISLAHFAPNPVVADGSFTGYVAWGRADVAGVGRVARCYLEPVPNRAADRLALARVRGTLTGADLPAVVYEHLRHPVEMRA